MQATVQLSFDVMKYSGPQAWPAPQGMRHRGRRQTSWVTPELAEFQRRALQAGRTPATAAVQMRAVRSMLKAVCRHGPHPIGLHELFRNAHLLAAAACDTARLDGRGDEKLTYATFAIRRIAARCFMRLMEDYLERDSDSLIAAFEAALRARCERVSLRFRPKGGRPAGRKIWTPTLPDIQGLLRELASCQEAYVAERNVAFVCFLASTGLRLSSAIGIDGRDFYRLTSGLWVAVPEKCKDERVQIRVAPEVEAALLRYVSAFDRHMARRRLSVRIGFGLPGAFWRCLPARPWTAGGAARTIWKASSRVCSAAFGPHAIRRFVAQELAKWMPRSSVAEALRWDGCAALDEHYGPPPGASWPPKSGERAGLAKGGGEVAAATQTASTRSTA